VVAWDGDVVRELMKTMGFAGSGGGFGVGRIMIWVMRLCGDSWWG
jgi:hypothetical protein